jgi:hypothetical protein
VDLLTGLVGVVLFALQAAGYREDGVAPSWLRQECADTV